jgi:OmcA/MtrC family decaheme c-type cytochrome
MMVGSAVLFSADEGPFTPRDKAYYADEALVNFVRPGLAFSVVSHEIAADGTVKVRFKITDPRGLGLDRLGVTTPGTVSSSFVISRIPKASKWHQTYTKRTKTSTYAPTAGKTARQSAADSGGSYQTIAEGEYVYTFGTKLPASYEKDATHTIQIYGNRNLSEFELGTNYATAMYNFVPAGGAVTKVRDVIGTASCNKCHTDLSFHGGSRKGMAGCVQCHTPAYEDVTNVNPETGASMDMTDMTHKIHAGANLPSVIAGGRYWWVGFGNSVADFSGVNMPSDVRNCAFCHDGKAPQGDAWLKNPTRAACGSCHDDVNFATGKGHINLPQPSDNLCANCHIPEGELEFDASIKGAHMIPQLSSMLPKIIAELKSVENAKPGEKPIVNFTLKKTDGSVWDIKTLNGLGLTLAGPTTDYISPTTRGYVREDPRQAATLTGDTYRYTFNTAIPADAKGSFTIGLDGRHVATVLEGTLKQQSIQYNIDNKVINFSVDGSAVMPRRTIVSTAKCNGCHANLTFHGNNRNQIGNCIQCHNPVETDAARRPANQMPAESVDMALMIHRIHAGNVQERDYTIYGFGNVPHNYNKIVYVGGLNNCSTCHEGTSYMVPVKAKADKRDPRGFLDPVKPATAACIGCHVSLDAASHALVNTSKLGESCGACHGSGKTYAVDKVHAN